MKKKLPRAVTQTAEEMRNAGPSAPSFGDNGVKGALAILDRATKSVATVVHPAAPAGDVRRASKAQAIVERYGNLASFGGLVPLPLVNVAGVTAIILRMVKLLCTHYGVPYDQGRARAIAVSLAAGAIPSTASAVTASTLVYLVPGANLLGMAISSVTASVCTRTVGYRFVQHFEAGATLRDFPVVERKRV